jgi:hypothetical protein
MRDHLLGAVASDIPPANRSVWHDIEGSPARRSFPLVRHVPLVKPPYSPGLKGLRSQTIGMSSRRRNPSQVPVGSDGFHPLTSELVAVPQAPL